MSGPKTPVPAPPSPEPIEIPCQITDADIEEMHDRLDSGMADLSTANAIVIALRRCLAPGPGSPALRRDPSLPCSAGCSWLLTLAGAQIPLPEEANRWMERWSTVGAGSPVSFRLRVPASFKRVFVRIDARPPQRDRATNADGKPSLETLDGIEAVEAGGGPPRQDEAA